MSIDVSGGEEKTANGELLNDTIDKSFGTLNPHANAAFFINIAYVSSQAIKAVGGLLPFNHF